MQDVWEDGDSKCLLARLWENPRQARPKHRQHPRKACFRHLSRDRLRMMEMRSSLLEIATGTTPDMLSGKTQVTAKTFHPQFNQPDVSQEVVTRPQSEGKFPDELFDPGDVPYFEASAVGNDDTSNQLLPPANFTPFFTLIEDVATGEHYHPSVHYIFSDDDPEILTNACMHIISRTPDGAAEAANVGGLDASPTSGTDSRGSTQVRSGRRTGTEERYLLLDVAPVGNAITSAQSLSSNWQVLDTAITQAPTFGAEEGGGGLMLRIEGIGNKAGGLKGRTNNELLEELAKAEDEDLIASLNDITERFRKDVTILEKVIAGYEDSTNLQPRLHTNHDSHLSSHANVFSGGGRIQSNLAGT